MNVRPLSTTDKADLLTWTNDRRLWPYILKHRFVNGVEHETFFEQLLTDKAREYFILQTDRGDSAGLCGLTGIDLINSKAELFIFISDQASQGKGLGSRAMDFLINYAFHQLFLHKLSLRVLCDNEKAITLYQHKGFDVDGILRDDFRDESGFKNVQIMSLIKGSECVK